MEYKITKCICYDTSFEEMKEIMKVNDFKTIEQLQQYKMVAGNCKLCLPYIKKMIETGKTIFAVELS